MGKIKSPVQWGELMKKIISQIRRVFSPEKSSTTTNVVVEKEKIPPTLAEQRKEFLSQWERNLTEFSERFKDLSEAIQHYQGVVSGSVGYTGLNEAGDVDIFFQSQEKAEAFILALKKSNYFTGTTEVPVKKLVEKTSKEGGYLYTYREWETINSKSQEAFAVCNKKAHKGGWEVFLDIRVVEKILSPAELLEQSPPVKGAFEKFLSNSVTSVYLVTENNGFSNQFDPTKGQWLEKRIYSYERVEVKSFEEAELLLQKKKSLALPGETISLEWEKAR